MSPISSSPPDTSASITASIGASPAPSPPSGWERAWLTQADSGAEMATPGAPQTQPQIRWFTLQQAVVDIQSLLQPGVQTAEAEEQPFATAPTLTPLVEIPLAEKTENDDEPTTNNTTANFIAPQIHQQVVLPPTPTGTQPEAPVDTAPAAPREAIPELPVSAPERMEDKAELVWSAEFVVQPQEQRLAHKPTPTTPMEGPAETQAQPAPALTGGDASTDNQEPSQQSDTATPDQPASPIKHVARPKEELAPPVSEHNASQPPAVSVSSVDSPAHPQPLTKEPPASTPIEPIIEPPAPLRPTQIATVQVDIPSPTGTDGDSPMRLIVSQRGEQVNVRLRSWDPSAAPIPDHQMQPLLDSLSAKGLVSETKPFDRLNEATHLVAEVHFEKLSNPAESAGANNGQQSFQNANDRQQQNQERQQQQQAFFLRKQMRNAHAEQFALPPALDGNTIRY